MLRRRAFRQALFLFTAWAAPVFAQAPPPLVDPEHFAPGVEGATSKDANGQSTEMKSVQGDIAEIKQDLQVLQETLDLIVNRMMADLEKENAQLRDEVRRLQEYGSPSSVAGGGFVPRPGAELFEQVSQEPLPEAPPPEPPAFTSEVVQEWGRDPETAARMGKGTSSLKGMVVLVPPASQRGDVEKLARELRSQFDAYDNINIEFFDDADAARSYADRQVSDPAHRVLSISKHKASGRDKILYLGGGENAEEVGGNNGAAAVSGPATEPATVTPEAVQETSGANSGTPAAPDATESTVAPAVPALEPAPDAAAPPPSEKPAKHKSKRKP